MPGRDLDSRRVEAAAALLGLRTALAEAAAFWQVGSVDCGACDGLEPLYVLVKAGYGGKEAFCVGVGGVIEDVFERSELHDFAGVDDGHGVAGLSHYSKVMGDEQHGGTGGGFELPDEVQHLSLDGDVESGSWFVGDEQPRVAGEGHSDDDALLHAAGELVGIFSGALGLDTDLFEYLPRLYGRLCPGTASVQAYELGDLLIHGQNGVQRAHGVLEYHRDVVPTDGAYKPFSPIKQLFSIYGTKN